MENNSWAHIEPTWWNQFFYSLPVYMKFFDLGNLPDFYRTILNYWQNFKLLTDNDKAAQNQIIWNNSNILLDGKPILYNSWLINGIIYIKDLLAGDKTFLSLANLKAKFNLNVSFTTYYGVLKTIPANWKKSIQNTDVQRGVPYEEELFARLPSTKTAYSIILSNSYSIPTAESKILNYGFTKDNIRKVYMLPFQILKEPKLIFFQFKIIHNIFPTQSNLFRAGIKDTDICPLCNSECQSLSHMLCTCHVSLTFWNQFRLWWRESFQEKITLSESVILYGWHKKSKTWLVLNYSLIIAKYHIFTTSVWNGNLNFEGFLLRLKNKLTILQTIAAKNNNLKQFTKTWTPVL